MNSLVVEVDLDKDIKFIQKSDLDVENMKRYLAPGRPSVYRLADDQALYFNNLLVVPSKGNLNLTPDVMKEAHDTPLSIHPSSTKMYQDLRQRYWWPNMKQDIKDLLELCNPLLFPSGNGTRSRWTSSLVFPGHRRVTTLSLSSLTDSQRLLILCLSRRRSLLVS